MLQFNHNCSLKQVKNWWKILWPALLIKQTTMQTTQCNQELSVIFIIIYVTQPYKSHTENIYFLLRGYCYIVKNVTYGGIFSFSAAVSLHQWHKLMTELVIFVKYILNFHFEWLVTLVFCVGGYSITWLCDWLYLNRKFTFLPLISLLFTVSNRNSTRSAYFHNKKSMKRSNLLQLKIQFCVQ